MVAAPLLAGIAPARRALGDDDPLIDSAAKALDVFDFERLARSKLPPAHFGYLAHGVDGIIVSNHGGRAEDSGRAAIDSLAEVAPAVNGRVPVLMDSGIRRGSDVFKALALGADAVGIGRPYIWGLASFGQEGVERVLEILRSEFTIAMRQAGARSVAEIDRTFVVHARRAHG